MAEKTGLAPSTVTHVLKGIHRNRRAEVLLCALMRPKLSVRAAFGAPGPESMRRSRAATARAADGTPDTTAAA